MKLSELFLEEVVSTNSVIGYHTSNTPNMEEVLANKEYKIGGSGGTGKGPGFYAVLDEYSINTLYGKHVYRVRIPIENFLIFDEKVFKSLKDSHFKKEVLNHMKASKEKVNSLFDKKSYNLLGDEEKKKAVANMKEHKKKETMGFFGAQLMYFGVKGDEALKYDNWFREKKYKTSLYEYMRKQTWFDRLRGTKIKGVIFSVGRDTTIISYFPQSVVVLGKAKDARKPGDNIFNRHSGFEKLDKDIILKQNKAKQTSFGDTKAPVDEIYKLNKSGRATRDRYGFKRRRSSGSTSMTGRGRG